MIKAGIVGGETHLGMALMRLLLNNPDVELEWVTHSEAVREGQRVDREYRVFTGDTDLRFTIAPDVGTVDVAFLCRRGGADLLLGELPAELRVVDLCSASSALPDYMLGLCEMNRKQLVHDCRRVVNPSPTLMTMMLGLLPLARNLMLQGTIVARTEIRGETIADEAQAATALLQAVQIGFTGKVDHEVTPVDQTGMVTTQIDVDCAVDAAIVRELYDSYYDDHNFVYVVDELAWTAEAAGTNKCFIHLDKQGNRLRITAAIDGAMKGTVGNAVHVMNLLFGLHERVGLAPM